MVGGTILAKEDLKASKLLPLVLFSLPFLLGTLEIVAVFSLVGLEWSILHALNSDGLSFTSTEFYS